MRLLRSTLTPRTFTLTPWHADTLWGHLCWHLVYRQGVPALHGFLDQYAAGMPPILLSDGFPGGFLPRPLLPPGYGAAVVGVTKAQRLEAGRHAKKMAKATWLTGDEFNHFCRGEAVVPRTSIEDMKPFLSRREVSKNWVNRATDTAGEPFDLQEIYQPQVTVYWRVADDQHEALVREFLEDLTQGGYGKRKSVGYGALKSWTLDECDDFAPVPNANAFVSLSRFVPQETDPTDGFWNITVKYGKLGEEFASGGDPFKQPLVQLECGSCFRTGDEPREYYGRLVEGIHAHRSEIKHYGFAFALPMKL